MTVTKLAPMIATSATARMIAGIAMMPSISRMMIPSSARKYPLTSPMRSPTTSAITATAIPIMSEARVP